MSSGEGRRDAPDHGAGFGLSVAIEEHVAHDSLAGGDQAECPRGGHAEVVHGLAAEKFPNR
jgi:hypothetical protein